MDETDLTQTMSMSWGSNTRCPSELHKVNNLDDNFEEFNDFGTGDDDFGDFATGAADSAQFVDETGSYEEQVVPKSDGETSAANQYAVQSPVHTDTETREAIGSHEPHEVQTEPSESDNMNDEVSPTVQGEKLSNPAVQPQDHEDTQLDKGSRETIEHPALSAEESKAVCNEGKVEEIESTKADDKMVASAFGHISSTMGNTLVYENSGAGNIQHGNVGTPITEESAEAPHEAIPPASPPHTSQPDTVQPGTPATMADQFESHHEETSGEDVDVVAENTGEFGEIEEPENTNDAGYIEETGHVDEFGTFADRSNENEFDAINMTNNNDDFRAIDTVGDDDDFGSFDNAGSDDEFGAFDETGDADDFGEFDDFGRFDAVESQTEPVDPAIADAQPNTQPIFERAYDIPPSLKDAIAMGDFKNSNGASVVWDETLGFMLPCNSDQDTSSKSIIEYQTVKDFVMEAHESLCPTITWHALTVNVDDDNGVPKVQWRNSRIERMYLDALSCWRRQSPLSPTLASPNVSSRSAQSPDAQSHNTSPKPMFDTNAPAIKPSIHISTKMQVSNTVEQTTPTTGSLPQIATSKLPASDSAPASAASVKSFDIPSISQVVDQFESNSPRTRASYPMQVSNTPASSEALESPAQTPARSSTPTQSAVLGSRQPSASDVSNQARSVSPTPYSPARPTTPTLSPNLGRKQQSLDTATPGRSSSPTPHSFKPTTSSRPLTPTRFNSQPRVLSPSPRAISPLESPKFVSQSPKNVSVESLATTPDIFSGSPEHTSIALEKRSMDSTTSVQDKQPKQGGLSPVTSPPATMPEKQDSWLSSNDMSFLDSLGATPSNTTKSGFGMNNAQQSPYNISVASSGFAEASGSSPDLVSSTPQTHSLDHITPTLLGNISPSTSPLAPLSEKRDSWLSFNDSAHALGGKPAPKNNSYAEPMHESSQGVKDQSPTKSSADALGFAEPESEFSDWTSSAPETQAIDFTSTPQTTQRNLSPISSPPAQGSGPENQNTWLSSNDISFLDALGGSSTSKPKSNGKSKQIGLGILDLDMFESPNAQAPNVHASRSNSTTAKILPKHSKPSDFAPLHNGETGGLGRLVTPKSPPAWASQSLSPTRSQTLSSLQSKSPTSPTRPAADTMFSGFNDFGKFSSSTPTPSTQPAIQPSSFSDSKWDIFRSASMSGSLSEWSSSLTNQQLPTMRDTKASAPTQPPKPVEALDDFGDFTAPGDSDDLEFGDFGSPDTTWSNNQAFPSNSSTGWL